MKKYLLLSGLFFLFGTAYSQYQIGIIPRVSPDRMVYQKIGYTALEIRYGSPSVQDRAIWGELVPYGKVWRAGANAATTVEFSTAVRIGGQLLDSGTYAFFVLPQEADKWTIIFNKTAKQWGAFKYDKGADALRVDVRPRQTQFKTERLEYSIRQTGFKYGSIVLKWDFMEIEVPFETNYLTEFAQTIETRAAKQPDYIQWIPYIQGAEHLLAVGGSIETAQKWIDQAETIMQATSEWNDQFYPRIYIEGHLYWIKARVLANAEQFAEAVAYVDKLKGLKEPLFYEREQEGEGIDAQYEAWKKR